VASALERPVRVAEPGCPPERRRTRCHRTPSGPRRWCRPTSCPSRSCRGGGRCRWPEPMFGLATTGHAVRCSVGAACALAQSPTASVRVEAAKAPTRAKRDVARLGACEERWDVRLDAADELLSVSSIALRGCRSAENWAGTPCSGDSGLHHRAHSNCEWREPSLAVTPLPKCWVSGAARPRRSAIRPGSRCHHASTDRLRTRVRRLVGAVRENDGPPVVLSRIPIRRSPRFDRRFAQWKR
jgi:hypothetical protein